MGGVLVLLALVVATLIFGLDGMEFSLPALVAVLAFGVLGFVDDFLRLRDPDALGLRTSILFGIELVIAIIIAIWAYRSPLIGSALHLPISGKEWDIGVWYVPLVILTILLEVNAAHLSDGMDGLVTSVSSVYALAQIAILAAMASVANQNGELLLGENLVGSAIFSAAVAGGGIGFLRYNTYPARIQAGSSGSLAFGCAVCDACNSQPLDSDPAADELLSSCEYGLNRVAGIQQNARRRQEAVPCGTDSSAL